MAMVTTILASLRQFIRDLTKKRCDAEYAAQNLSRDQIEQANREKAKRYFNLVLLGATSILWGDITTAVARLEYPLAVTAFDIYLNFVMVSIFGGAIAAALPDLTRYYLSVSGNGVLQGFIFAIVVFNVEAVSRFRVFGWIYELAWWATGCLSVLAITLYWTLSTEDPMWALVLLRLAGWITLFVLQCVWWIVWLVLYAIWLILGGACGFLKWLARRAKLIKSEGDLQLPLSADESPMASSAEGVSG